MQELQTYVQAEVRTVGGELLARLSGLAASDTIGALRDRIAHGTAWRSRIVHGCTVLPDHRSLGSLRSADADVDAPLLLTMVNLRPSSLAAHLEEMGQEATSLVDIIDSVLHTEFAQSVKHQPSAQDVAMGMPTEVRSQVVCWLGLACDAMSIDDTLLHGAVLTLDRYAAAVGSRLEEGALQRLSLAALCTEMKMANVDDFPMGYWQRLLLHLGQGRERLSSILQTEAEMLRRLDFVTGVPTTLTFFHGLSLRHCHGPTLSNGRRGPSTPGAALRLGLAQLLLELALYDIDLEYRFKPAVLAAGALGASLFATGPLSLTDGGQAGRPELELLGLEHAELHEDLASYCPEMSDADVMISACELNLLTLWEAAASAGGVWTDCYGHLRTRHGRQQRAQAKAAADAQDTAGGEPLPGVCLADLSPEAAIQRFHAFAAGPCSGGANGEAVNMELDLGE